MKTNKLKVLTICSAGLNRSKYLAGYLRRKGYSTKFRGLEPEKYAHEINTVQQKDIDWADVIITVRPRLKKLIKKKFKIGRKELILLDVSDSRRLLPKEYEHLKELDYLAFQKKWTRPQLRKALKPYLPLMKKKRG